ncbi:MAG: TetR/AcrR family transcriptional regulator [Symploca sp. SIO3E6]|nr:TetR/AcrR family transcriptional regulator [Caldora sp. SIO3E6]
MSIQSTNKKQRILEATMELIAENGLHATPMSQISKRSKVSAGTIYHYFPNKETLINHLYLDLKKEIADVAFRDYDIQAPYQERFFLIWQNSLNHLISKPMQLSFIEQCSISPLISQEAKETSARYLAPLFGFIAEGIESGYLKKIDIQLILYLIHGTILSTAKLQLSGLLEITDDHREAAAQACWDGLKTG